MKKRIRLIIIIVISTLLFFLLAWRFWPRPFSDLFPADKSSITGFTSLATIHRIENGEPITDIYRIDNFDQAGIEPTEILEILAASGYRRDLRNLLPWKLDYVDADKNYDGRTVLLIFSIGDQADEYTEVQFTSSSTVLVFVGGEEEFRIYHPTNRETLDQLVKYFQTYGVKE